MLSFLVLARLLAPKDFGLIALAVVVIFIPVAPGDIPLLRVDRPRALDAHRAVLDVIHVEVIRAQDVNRWWRSFVGALAQDAWRN